MRNTISKTVTGLIYQAQRALPGVQANLVALGYSNEQGNLFKTRVDDAVGARDTHAAAEVGLGASRVAYAETVKTGREVVMTARDALKPFLGRKRSAAWIEAGFVDSLAVAKDAAGLLRTVQGLKAYFTAHPEHENALLNVTASRFTNLATDLITLAAALDNAKANVITLAKERDSKAKLVRAELRLLLSKLRVSFDRFSPMWEAVGFNRPGFVSVPEVPSNLVAVNVGPVSAALKWDHAVRADRYRVWKKVAGVDEEFVVVDTRDDLDCVIEGLPANATIQLAISAVNSGGESAKSEILTIMTAPGQQQDIALPGQ